MVRTSIPTQALLDAYSIQEKLGRFEWEKDCYYWRYYILSEGSIVQYLCLKKMGAEFTLCGLPTLVPKYIQRLGVNVSSNLEETLQW